MPLAAVSKAWLVGCTSLVNRILHIHMSPVSMVT